MSDQTNSHILPSSSDDLLLEAYILLEENNNHSIQKAIDKFAAYKNVQNPDNRMRSLLLNDLRSLYKEYL